MLEGGVFLLVVLGIDFGAYIYYASILDGRLIIKFYILLIQMLIFATCDLSGAERNWSEIIFQLKAHVIWGLLTSGFLSHKLHDRKFLAHESKR